jgi:hypothetical protein
MSVWRWLRLGPSGRVYHLVQPWKASTAREARYDTACGNHGASPVPTLMDPDGLELCLPCYRKVLKEPEP